MAKQKLNTTPFWRFMFILYCCILIWLLFGRSFGWVEGFSYKELLQQNLNLTPLYTIGNYWQVLCYSQNGSLVRHCFINLAGNVLLFIPVGWLLPRLWKRLRNYFRFFAVSSGLIFLVETVQLFSLLGSFDVDDVILNLFGMTLGFILYSAFKKKH